MSNSMIWVFSYIMIKSLDGIFVLNEKFNDFLKLLSMKHILMYVNYNSDTNVCEISLILAYY